ITPTCWGIRSVGRNFLTRDSYAGYSSRRTASLIFSMRGCYRDLRLRSVGMGTCEPGRDPRAGNLRWRKLGVMSQSVRTRMDHLHDRVEDAFDEVKPHLRGWLHAGTVPVALPAGIVLVALSPTAETRAGSAVFAVSALLLFTVSALCHR